MILFGSRARGDYTESSDYDVLYVDDNIPVDPKKVDNNLYLKVVNMFDCKRCVYEYKGVPKETQLFRPIHFTNN
ncbi:nucleotidyltransferase domain-containing protein [Sulfurisphaera javensis]|uniref:nucleotidyltransferase domain-containing protein n=1 Tax=Sulfurisphaera javensis TaxID=2049879 RepID=UPI0034E85004